MKVTLGKSKHKVVSLPPQSFDVNTTSDFGFMQPTCGCIELVPGSKMHISHKSLVRFHTMNSPTFGRISQRTYHYYVPISDIYHPFESFLAQKPYFGTIQQYIPSEVPSVTPFALLCLLSRFSFITPYILKNGSVSLGGTLEECEDTAEAQTAYKDLLGNTIGSTYFTNHSLYDDTNNVNLARCINSTYSFGFADQITDPSTCDFVLNWNEYVFCVRLNRFGRNLRKILLGLGYQLCQEDFTKVSLLPLFAYYKVYFDHWKVQRHITWKQSNLHSVIERIEQNNLIGNEIFDLPTFLDAIEEMTMFYYVDNPDYFSSQISGAAVSDSSSSFDVISRDGTDSLPVFQGDTSFAPSLYGTNNSTITYARLRALEFLTKYVNKNTVIGGKIDTWLKVHYGADYIQREDSYYIGCDVNDINISEVISSADTASADGGADLGQRGAKAEGYVSGQSFTIDSRNTFGYYINMTVIVPLSRFSQGINPNLYHVGRFDFYTPEADGITLVPTNKMTLYCDSNPSHLSYDATFGNQSIYQEYKCIPNNIVSGDMNLASTRNSYDAYYLDRILTPSHFEYDSSTGAFSRSFTNPSDLVCSPNWRIIGLDRFIGNYNRIFMGGLAPTNSFIPEDDFMTSQHVYNVRISAPVLPYADSFETDSFKDGLTVEHE